MAANAKLFYKPGFYEAGFINPQAIRQKGWK